MLRRVCLVAVYVSTIFVGSDAFQAPGLVGGAFTVARGRMGPTIPLPGRAPIVAQRAAAATLRISSDPAPEKYVAKPKPVLDMVNYPADMKRLTMEQLKQLAYELRWEVAPRPGAAFLDHL